MDGGRLVADRAGGPPVSTQISMDVPAAKVGPFEDLLHEVLDAARTFDGHLGVDVLRPNDGGTYRIIFRFRSRDEHDAWMESDRRHVLVGRVVDLLEGDGLPEVRSVDGWEGWFVTSNYSPPVPPQRWKMAAVTLAALYPMVLALTLIFQSITRGWPLPLAMLLTMTLTIPLMTWVIMPRLTVWLGPWLRDDGAGRANLTSRRERGDPTDAR
jgi:antibiotic biosynthesis monooxygenase (ABM) superfamily enzyme